MSRRSLSRKAKSATTHIPSLLQRQFEQATNSPGGIHKIFTLIRNTSDDDIKLLNEHQWSPLIGAVFRLGKNTTRNGNKPDAERGLIQLIRTCHERNLSLDSGAYFAEHFHRPLTITAYFGFYDGVRALLELGALPDLTDGEGKTAWHTSFDNPCASSNAFFRECDKYVANTLLEMGVVTSTYSDWQTRNALQAGKVCYINVESKIGSPLFRALLNKRLEVVRFIVENDGSISDREYLILYRRGDVKRLLVRMVEKLCQSAQQPRTDCNACTLKNSIYAKYTRWSYTPKWKAGVDLCICEWDRCGLPPNMVQSRVVPYLARDWFFTNEELKSNELPARMIASGAVST